MISASDDKTIKFWDLGQPLEAVKKKWDHPIVLMKHASPLIGIDTINHQFNPRLLSLDQSGLLLFYSLKSFNEGDIDVVQRRLKLDFIPQKVEQSMTRLKFSVQPHLKLAMKSEFKMSLFIPFFNKEGLLEVIEVTVKNENNRGQTDSFDLRNHNLAQCEGSVA